MTIANLRVPTNRLRKGMILKNNVYSKSGTLLVAENTPITKDVVSILSRHFIDNVVVEYGTDMPTPPLSPQPRKVTAMQFQEFQNTFEIAEESLSQQLRDIAATDTDIDVAKLLGVLNQIIEKSENDMNLCDMLSMMKTQEESLYTHSINVALFSQILAKWMNFEHEDIELVMIAALLHDIGILKLSPAERRDFSFKQELENARYEKHVIQGYHMIKDKNLDNRVKQAVLTHHERLDGRGFPLQVAISNINRISRCIAIADVYDTLTMNEASEEGLSPFDALRKMEDDGARRLDSEMLMTFISKIAYTFVQHNVILNTGEHGHIVLINKYNLSRPMVQVGEAFIDLATRNDIYIKKLLD